MATCGDTLAGKRRHKSGELPPHFWPHLSSSHFVSSEKSYKSERVDDVTSRLQAAGISCCLTQANHQLQTAPAVNACRVVTD